MGHESRHGLPDSVISMPTVSSSFCCIVIILHNLGIQCGEATVVLEPVALVAAIVVATREVVGVLVVLGAGKGDAK